MLKKLPVLIIICLVPVILVIVSLIMLPWFLDKTKPLLVVQNLAEQGFYKTGMEIRLSSSKTRGKLANCRIVLDYVPVFEKKLDVASFAIVYTISAEKITEGAHRIDFIVTDNTFHKNSARVYFNFTFDRTAPELHWVSRSDKVEQGKVLPVFIRTPGEKKVTLTGTFLKQNFIFYPVLFRDQLFCALLPVDALRKKGNYPLFVHAVDGAGNESDATFPVEVLHKAFSAEVIVLSAAKTAVLTDKNAAIVNRDKMEEALRISAPVRYWQDKFTRPIQGIVSSLFGMQRVYNTGVVSSYHKGLDIANKQGTPVFAANRGRVVLAEELPLNGNCIIIDHGQELFSMYFHLHTILVQPGQDMEKGVQIGTVGTTGISTGPHLHWEMRIRNISVDPVQWEKEDLGNFIDIPTHQPG